MSFIPNLLGDGREIAVGSNHTNTTGAEAEPWESAVYIYEPNTIVTLPWQRRKISQNIYSIPRANQAAPGIFGWGDADGDGDIDILLSGDGDKRIFVLEQQPGGEFKTKVLFDELTQAGGMKVKDLNQDGRPELWSLAMTPARSTSFLSIRKARLVLRMPKFLLGPVVHR